MRRTVSVLVGVAGLALFAGCANGPQKVDGVAAPDNAATPTATAVPVSAVRADPAKPSSAPTKKPTVKTPTSTAPVTPKVLGPTGFGALKLGMSVKQAEATGLLGGKSNNTGGCDSGHWLKKSKNATVYTSAAGVIAITAYPNLSTPEGIELGSSFQAMKKAYPDWENLIDPGTEGRGVAKIPGNSRGIYRISITDGKVSYLQLVVKSQNCFE